MDSPNTARHIANILNAAWMVRYYARGGRSSILRTERTEAIKHLGIAVRDAFNESEDFEPLLAAVVDGLRPKDTQPF